MQENQRRRRQQSNQDEENLPRRKPPQFVQIQQKPKNSSNNNQNKKQTNNQKQNNNDQNKNTKNEKKKYHKERNRKKNEQKEKTNEPVPRSKYRQKLQQSQQTKSKKSKYVQKSDTIITDSQRDIFSQWNQSHSDSGTNSSKSSGVIYKDDGIGSKFRQLFLAFEDQELSQRKIRKISFVKQYGDHDEHIIKSMIKKYINDKSVKNIFAINLLIDQAYPKISLQYKTNSSFKQTPQQVQIMELIRSVQKDEYLQKQITKLCRTIFFSSYTEITSKQLLSYKSPINEKIQVLNKKNCYFRQFKQSKQLQNILACYCNYQNNFNFLMVDKRWNQIRFNNIFIELNKQKFSKASQVLTQISKGIIQKQNNKEQFNAMMMQNQQISSDQQQIISKPVDMIVIKRKLTELFNDRLQQFENDIQAKQEEEERLRSLVDQNHQQQLQKIMEQISELDTNLEQYKQKRQIFIKQNQKQKLTDQRLYQIYKELRMLKNQLGSKLPIISRKKQLFRLLNSTSLIVLQGQTGSGKSTQLPQMLCQYYKVFSTKNSKSILLTQPRKIAARTLSQRIAMQLDEQVHGFVDFVSSSGKKPQKQSKIVLMLDRLLLDELQKDPNLSNYHCLVIDQAHQRTLSIDILIGLIKRVIDSRPDFKVIITSATLDATLFQRFFSIKTFKVSGRMFPVQIVYQPYESGRYNNVDKIKNILNTEILKMENRQKYRGHILVFCTSVDEINTLCNQYSNKAGIKSLPLHGKLSNQQQKLIFEPEEHLTKLIFSSRIAETAVTIDKIKVVVDLGEDRQTIYDQKKKITAFQLKPISKSAAKQRAGRAGRTGPGYCFRLYSQQFQQKDMSDNKNPQIKTVPLDTLVLRLKQLKIKDIINFPYIQSPDQEALKQSQDRMQIIGCLDELNQITQIGLLLVKMPIEPFMSRAIAEGIIININKPRRKILDQLLKTLVMIVNGQNIFYSKYGDNVQKQQLEKIRFHQFADKDGDFFSLLKVYQAFQISCRNKNSHFWCKQKFLNKKVLFQATQLYRQVKQIVDTIKFNTQNCREFEQEVMIKQRSFQNNKDLILSCILPSFCQQLCLYSGNNKVGYTSIKRQVPLQIYGSSFLSLQGINPKWIVSFDVFQTSNTFCRFAQSVTFDILKKSIPQRLFKRYKISQCEKQNPFYQYIPTKLPTVLFNTLRTKHENVSEQLQFLQQSSVLFYHELNLVEIYTNKFKAQQIKTQFEKKLKQMRIDIQKSYQNYTHHYLGSVTVIMSSGCYPQKINFSNYLYAAKISGITVNCQYMIQMLFSDNVVKRQVNQKYLILYFTNQSDRNIFKQKIDAFKKQNMKQLSQMVLKLEKGFQQRRDKIATVKVKVRFYIGEPRNTNNLLLLGYSRQEAQLAQHFMDQHDRNGIISGIRISNKGERPPVTVFLNRDPNQMDQVDFEQYLQQIMRDNAFGWKPPAHIKGFRDIDTHLSLKADDEWIKKIKQLIGQIDQTDITIRGQGPKKDSQFFTNMTADIKMYDAVEAQKFRRKYDKKRNILGNQKMHVNLKYSQTIVRISPYVFKIFNKQFDKKKQQVLAQYPNLQIVQRQIQRNRQYFVLIQSYSSQRQNLTKTANFIKQVFKAQSIPLNPLEVKILNKKVGYQNNYTIYLSDRIFDQLRCQYDYDVQFQMLRKFTYIKVYSCNKDLVQIQDRLKQKIKQYQNLMIIISYRGKNIHEVIKILDKHKTQNGIQFEIYFSEKNVQLIGNLDVLSEIENSINQLVEKGKGDCQICQSVMLSPYTLFNCQHTFCKYCLVSSVRQNYDNLTKYPIMCPFDKCKKKINIHDLKYLFDQQQFDRMCDLGVQRIIDDEHYHACKTPDCEMIFEVKQSKRNKSFKCDLCTIHYCFLCKDVYHPGYTCQQYQQSKGPNGEKLMMKKMGIKYCGRCSAPIIKNGGCQHVTCIKCQAHICWKCQKIFSTSKQCYDHLAQQCGGIFDPQAQQQQNRNNARVIRRGDNRQYRNNRNGGNRN